LRPLRLDHRPRRQPHRAVGAEGSCALNGARSSAMLSLERRCPMPVNIDKFGRIDGSRTAVFHVRDHYVVKDPPEYIIKWLPLTLEQVQAAFRFIEENR